MEFEVLFTGDEGIYIIEKDHYFYTIDILEDIKPMKSQYVESFLKFGGFEGIDQQLDIQTVNKIKAVLFRYKI